MKRLFCIALASAAALTATGVPSYAAGNHPEWHNGHKSANVQLTISGASFAKRHHGAVSCSGTVISDRHVITASHCFYPAEMTALRIDAPGTVTAKTAPDHQVSNVHTDLYRNGDLAVVTFPAGSFTGVTPAPFGIQTPTSPDGMTFRVCGRNHVQPIPEGQQQVESNLRKTTNSMSCTTPQIKSFRYSTRDHPTWPGRMADSAVIEDWGPVGTPALLRAYKRAIGENDLSEWAVHVHAKTNFTWEVSSGDSGGGWYTATEQGERLAAVTSFMGAATWDASRGVKAFFETGGTLLEGEALTWVNQQVYGSVPQPTPPRMSTTADRIRELDPERTYYNEKLRKAYPDLAQYLAPLPNDLNAGPGTPVPPATPQLPDAPSGQPPQSPPDSQTPPHTQTPPPGGGTGGQPDESVQPAPPPVAPQPNPQRPAPEPQPREDQPREDQPREDRPDAQQPPGNQPPAAPAPAPAPPAPAPVPNPVPPKAPDSEASPSPTPAPELPETPPAQGVSVAPGPAFNQLAERYATVPFFERFTTPAPGVTTQRIAGETRIDTAAKMFADAPNPRIAVLSTGRSYADGLAGGALAGVLKTGILLTNATGDSPLEPALLATLKARGTTTVYITGGKNAIGKGVEDSLFAAGIEVKRLAGFNRFETADLVAQEAAKLLPSTGPVFVASGANFPDALVASSAAARLGGTVRLVDETHPYSGSGYCIGGPACAHAPNATKIVGKDRFETAYQLAARLPFSGKIIAVSGKNFPDALAAGALSATTGATMVLTDGEQIGVPQGTTSVTLVGGPSVIAPSAPIKH